MKVEKVSANIRYSQDTGKGAWKVIELGAESSVEAREHWQAAQAFLYSELGKQMKTLWSNGTSTGAGRAVNGQDRSESHADEPAGPEPTQKRSRGGVEHWCEAHRQEFKRRSKNGTVWYSHRQGSAWCNEEG